MAPGNVLGEFEYLVMLAVMQLEGEGSALEMRALLEEKAERSVSRGALYATLERLERKGYLSWVTEEATPERGGIPRRLFHATADGHDAVRRSSLAISRLSEGLSLP
jgi:DNA-binding PadR family transcriptional regulator